jgi:hypothetical protein
MGSMISLAVGRLEIDWGKNNGFVDYSALFQAGDVAQIPYYYAGKEIKGADSGPDWEVISEVKEGLSKPFALVIDRINLLGNTHSVCEAEFAALAEFNGFDATTFFVCGFAPGFVSYRCRLTISELRRRRRGFRQVLPARDSSPAWP